VDFQEGTPIYLQLRDRIRDLILDGELKEGDAAPSVRQISVDMKVNPITVSRSYQELVEAGVLEKRRGIGMYVSEGARERLLQQERQSFLRIEWPSLQLRLKRLGIQLKDLETHD
jgi:GntR family transcriptional regulator